MTGINHRRRSLILGAATLAIPNLATAGTTGNIDFWSKPRRLQLRRPATGESVSTVYWEEGRIIRSEYDRINHILRDVRANETCAMDVNLLNILAGIQGWFSAYGQPRWIEVTSGYRTRATNGATEGAAKDSQHVEGKAADIRITGVPSEYLYRLGQYLQGGGVGWYPTRNFVHVDTGRLRTWASR